MSFIDLNFANETYKLAVEAKQEGVSLNQYALYKLSSGIVKRTDTYTVSNQVLEEDVKITIHEGRNHQVRKMFEALGYQVLKLKREKYANLDLRGLKPGEYRKLSNKEIAILYSMVK